MLDGSDTEHASLADGPARLSCEGLTGATGSQDENTVVDEVLEVGKDQIDDLRLAISEEAIFLFSTELVNNGGEKVQCVWLIERVCIHGRDNANNLVDVLRLGQKVEERLVFAELRQNGGGVQRHVDVLVLVRELVKERLNDHIGLLLEDGLHLLLICGELGLGIIVAWVAQITVVRSIWSPFVLLFWENLLLNELNEEGRDRVVVEMAKQTAEDLSLLVQEKVFENHLLLSVKELLHDFEEIAAKNVERLIIFVEEGAESVEESVVVLGTDWLSGLGSDGLVLEVGGSTLGVGVVGI